jgi:zinc transport system permease protein
MQNALIVSLFIGVICPCIGIFTVLRRQSMIGDTLSHASLAGVTLGLMAGVNPILGAFVFTSASGLLIEFLRKFFAKYTDLILTIVYSLSIGIAITIISSGILHVNADGFLFGSVLTVTSFDILVIMILSVLTLFTVILLYHQMIYISYDEETAKIIGVRTRLINYIFAILVASSVAISIRIVGIMVIGAMIAIPIATALQLGQGFRKTLIFGILISIFDIVFGLILSYHLGVAPGGFTAILSVVVLVGVIVGKMISGKRLSPERKMFTHLP